MTATETRKALMRCNLPSEQIKLIEDYARLQIEKDRGLIGQELWDVDFDRDRIHNLPIQLD